MGNIMQSGIIYPDTSIHLSRTAVTVFLELLISFISLVLLASLTMSNFISSIAAPQFQIKLHRHDSLVVAHGAGEPFSPGNHVMLTAGQQLDSRRSTEGSLSKGSFCVPEKQAAPLFSLPVGNCQRRTTPVLYYYLKEISPTSPETWTRTREELNCFVQTNYDLSFFRIRSWEQTREGKKTYFHALLRFYLSRTNVF